MFSKPKSRGTQYKTPTYVPSLDVQKEESSDDKQVAHIDCNDSVPHQFTPEEVQMILDKLAQTCKEIALLKCICLLNHHVINKTI